MNDASTEVKVSRFIGDAASWSALGVLGADLLRLLLGLGLKKDDIDLTGALIGLLIAIAFAIPRWTRTSSDFGRLRRNLFQTDVMFIFGMVDEAEYRRLRQNQIERFG